MALKKRWCALQYKAFIVACVMRLIWFGRQEGERYQDSPPRGK